MADATEAKSKKPSNSAFKQQRLKAWQPILTPNSVLPTFFIIGLIFVPLGVALLLTSNNVTEYVVDYTTCHSLPVGERQDGSGHSLTHVKTATNASTCDIELSIDADMTGPIFLYYRLTNFYQNHRRYVKSFDAKQLQGDARTVDQLDGCDPLIVANDTHDGIAKPIYPCGLIANSIFNDTYGKMTGLDGLLGTTYEFSTSGIAWPTDKNKYGPTKYSSSDVVPPPNWAKFNGTYHNVDLASLDLAADEPFMVWMRTAGLPTFRKLWGRIDDAAGIKKGKYVITIGLNYDVESYGGTKALVLSTTSWLGGKNPFLGIAYIVVGTLCIVLGLVFLARHCIKPRKLGDPRFLSWNKNK